MLLYNYVYFSVCSNTLNNIEHTNVTGPVEKNVNETLTVQCKDGYRLHNKTNDIDSQTMTCPNAGSWPTFPGCELKGMLTHVSDIVVSGYTYSSHTTARG